MSSEEDRLNLEPESNLRSHCGVVAHLQLLETGEVRLILDDVCSQTNDSPTVWEFHWPFTRHDFPGKEFLACELSAKQLAEIGLNLVSRLTALTTKKQQ